MPQTRFVTQKTFAYSIKPIVVINKIDRLGIRPDWVFNQVFDLFVNLGANDEQLDFPIIYTSALQGIAGFTYNDMANDMTPLLESIVKNVTAPNVDVNSPFQMQISQLEYNKYFGVIGVGRINRGRITPNQNVMIINNQANKYRNGKVLQIMGNMGLKRIKYQLAEAGDIIAITGLN